MQIFSCKAFPCCKKIEDNKLYLNTSSFSTLHIPVEIIPSIQENRCLIPIIEKENTKESKELDIRPPTQLITLLPDSQVKFIDNATIILMMDNDLSSVHLWSKIISIFQENHYPISIRDDTNHILVTDWINWHHLDKGKPYHSRYKINVKSSNYKTKFILIKLLNLRKINQPITDIFLMQRYNAEMFNIIASGLEQFFLKKENKIEDENIFINEVKSSVNDVGLPILLINRPFNQVWKILPNILKKIDIKVTRSVFSTGNMTIVCKPPSNSKWKELGVYNLGLEPGNYELQLGDLGYQSSLQFINTNGYTITQSQNDTLAEVLKTIFNKLE